MFGTGRKVILHLLDIPAMEEKLGGIEMEIQDCAGDLVAGVVCTSDVKTAFTDIDVALLVGARPRGPGMERSDLLAANAAIFKSQGEALEAYAKKSVLVLVVGNPANTNALIASAHAPSIPRQNFSALTRLDHNRAKALLAKKVGAEPSKIRNVIIWGNHSTTQYPDARFAVATAHARGHDSSSVTSLIGNPEWFKADFVTAIQQRGKSVIDKRGASSAASASSAICDAMRDWYCGSNGEIVSMGVYTDGTAYGIASDLIFSMPVVCEGGGKIRVVSDLSIDAFSAEMLSKTEAELKDERELALPGQFGRGGGGGGGK
jgi:malate dehydrogenase